MTSLASVMGATKFVRSFVRWTISGAKGLVEPGGTIFTSDEEDIEALVLPCTRRLGRDNLKPPHPSSPNMTVG